MKRSTRRRNWLRALEKVAGEGSRCRVCRSSRDVECAHITGREHDREFPVRNEDWTPFTVHPDRIVPLCKDHHLAFDAGLLDLLPHLTVHETLQAVADSAGPGDNGLESARIRLCPSAYGPFKVAA